MLSYETMKRVRSQRSSEHLMQARRLDEGIELYREASSLGAFHEQERITNEMISSLLLVEERKIAEERRHELTKEKVDKKADRSLEDVLTCSLCKQLFHVPITLICGHTFCRDCLTACKYHGHTVCPECGLHSSLLYSSNLLIRDLSHAWFSTKTNLRTSITEAKELLMDGKLQEFLTRVEALLLQHPGNAELFCLRADGNLRLENPVKALNDLEKACNLSPFNSKAFHTRGEVLAKLGETEEALLMFLRASALQPNDPTYRSCLTSYLSKLLGNICDSSILCANTGEQDAVRSIKHLQRKTTKLQQVSLCSTYKRQSMKFVQGECKSGENEPSLSTAGPHGKIRAGEPFCSAQQDEMKKYPLRLEPESEAQEPKSLFPDDLECKLCFSMIYQPVTTPCGHSFCSSCLRRCLDHRFECPCCRANLKEYLELLTKGVVGSCYVLEKILLLNFREAYESRKSAYEEELMRFSRGKECVAEIPIFVCTLAVPGIACPLHIFEPRYKLMIRRCMESGSREFGMCVPDPVQGYATVGTILYINDVKYLPDGRSIVHTVGSRRFKVVEKGMKDGYNTAKVEWLGDEHVNENECSILNREVYVMMTQWFENLPQEQQVCIVKALGEMPDPLQSSKTDGLMWLWWLVVAMPLNVEAKRIILSMTSLTERLKSAKRFLAILISRQL